MSMTASMRQLATSLLLSVFIALAFIPSGFMPDFSKGADGFIKICSGLDEKTIPDGSHHGDPCAFSLNVSTPPSIQAVIFPAPMFGAPVYEAPAYSVTSQNVFNPHAPRAPPITL